MKAQKEFLTLPEPRRRMREVVRDLCYGKNVLWFINQQDIIHELIEEIKNICEQEGLTSVSIFDCSKITEIPAIYFYGQFAEEQVLDRPTVRDLMALDTIPDCMIFCGLSSLSNNTTLLWTSFIHQWAHESRQHSKAGVLLVVLSDTALIDIIKKDVNIQYHWLWGWMPSQEVRLMAQTLVKTGRYGYLQSYWIDAVLSELAGTDVFLLERLITKNSQLTSQDKILEELCDYAVERQWDAEAKPKDITYYEGIRELETTEPPIYLHRYWTLGMVDWHQEEGITFHSAALAIWGDERGLQHRVWRGQARQLLPLLERVRREICLCLSFTFKAQWREHCRKEWEDIEIQKHASTEGGIAAEYGEICEFLQKISSVHYSKFRNFKSDIHQLKSARNHIAHYTPLSWDKIGEIMKAIERIRAFIEHSMNS